MYLFDSPGEGLGQPPSPSTNCSAISGDRFDKQPPALQEGSFHSRSWTPQNALTDLIREQQIRADINLQPHVPVRRVAHVRRILKTGAGEAPFMVADRALQVPGLTASVYFMSQGQMR